MPPADFAAAVQTNVLGTQGLLEAARQVGIGRFHHVSSIAAAGLLLLPPPGSDPDQFVLQLPLMHGAPTLAVIAFAARIVRPGSSSIASRKS